MTTETIEQLSHPCSRCGKPATKDIQSSWKEPARYACDECLKHFAHGRGWFGKYFRRGVNGLYRFVVGLLIGLFLVTVIVALFAMIAIVACPWLLTGQD